MSNKRQSKANEDKRQSMGRKSMAKRQSMGRKSMAKRQSMGRKSMAKRQSIRRKSSKTGRKSRKSTALHKGKGNAMERRGQDKFAYCNGDKYEGDWLAVYPDIFVRDGEGTYTCSDGTVYSGLWEIDLLVSGRINWPCGQKYSGDFKEQKMHGIGTYTFPGRGELSGTFVDNFPVGDVVFLDMAGMKYIGRVDSQADTVRMKMLNHLVGGFTKDDLVLPKRPEGVDEQDDLARNEKNVMTNSSKRASRKSKQSQSSRGRQSKSSTGMQRASVKKK